jgi:hypothetical protein
VGLSVSSASSDALRDVFRCPCTGAWFVLAWEFISLSGTWRSRFALHPSPAMFIGGSRPLLRSSLERGSLVVARGLPASPLGFLFSSWGNYCLWIWFEYSLNCWHSIGRLQCFVGCSPLWVAGSLWDCSWVCPFLLSFCFSYRFVRLFDRTGSFIWPILWRPTSPGNENVLICINTSFMTQRVLKPWWLWTYQNSVVKRAFARAVPG